MTIKVLCSLVVFNLTHVLKSVFKPTLGHKLVENQELKQIRDQMINRSKNESKKIIVILEMAN